MADVLRQWQLEISDQATFVPGDCCLPDGGADRSVVHMPGHSTFVKSHDLQGGVSARCPDPPSVFLGFPLGLDLWGFRGLTASTFHFLTWSRTIPWMSSESHQILGLSCSSGWFRAMHRLGWMPRALHEPWSSCNLVSPSP